MKKWKLLAATLISAAVLAPGLAAAADMAVVQRDVRTARHWYGLPYPISYLHNYGPGVVPGSFAFQPFHSLIRRAKCSTNAVISSRRSRSGGSRSGKT